jgi:hypothetical protein
MALATCLATCTLGASEAARVVPVQRRKDNTVFTVLAPCHATCELSGFNDGIRGIFIRL